jgi:hypothetical protein
MPVLLKCLFTKQMKRQYSMLEKIFFTSMHVQNLKQEKKNPSHHIFYPFYSKKNPV